MRQVYVYIVSDEELLWVFFFLNSADLFGDNHPCKATDTMASVALVSVVPLKNFQ